VEGHLPQRRQAGHMLTSWTTRGILVLVMAGVLSAGPGRLALAAGGGSPGSGGPFGGVQCGQSNTPGCAVTAAAPADRPSAVPVAGKPATGTGAPAGCTGTRSPGFGCVPAGCAITVQTVACPLPQMANNLVTLPPPPAVLAQLAVKYLRLPDPVIRSSPAPGVLQLTRLPVWLWVGANVWQPQSKTAQVRGESVSATATPVSAAWSMGDGKTVTCKGPGTPYGGGNAAVASPTCGYTYNRSSAGQPGAYRVTVAITWDITWVATGGAGGALAPLHTAAAAQFRVAESQALNTSGG
jgi:hypothetical protein